MSNPTATHLVLTTPELLAHILSFLPCTTLLPLSLVSPFFQHTILTSPTLQRTLYLRPDPNLPPRSWTLNPLLRRHFLPFFVTPGQGVSMPGYNALQRLDWMNAGDSAKDAFLRKEASWRRMLLIQPPPAVLDFTSAMDMQGELGVEDAVPLSFSGGVTMGLVYDIVESFVGYGGAMQTFGLAISSGEEGTRIRLCLDIVIQCCPITPTERNMVSKGAASEREVDRVEWIRTSGKCGPRESLRKTWRYAWKMEGVEQREGVGKHEWNEWSRVRADLGDLIADVRGE